MAEDSKISGNFFADVQNIVESARQYAYNAVNVALVQRNWLIGKRIAEEELKGENRAEYGTEIIKDLSAFLTNNYGNGFTKTNLYQFVQFYKCFPDIFHAVSGKSILLSWTHYRTLLRVDNENARNWYLNEAIEQVWSVRTLDRNIASQYYERLLLSQNRKPVEDEMKKLTAPMQDDKLEFIKNPVIAEFLGLANNPDFTETGVGISNHNQHAAFFNGIGQRLRFCGPTTAYPYCGK